MANFQQNDINFTIANNFQPGEKNHPIKGKLVSAFNDYTGYEGDDASKLINAVEIDWNGAEIELPDALGGGTEIINTTGQLFRRL